MIQKTLYIFRHGETDWNLEGRMQGGTDISLNANGQLQASKLKDFFVTHPVEAFISSDLGRARATAEIARGTSMVPIFIEPRIRETNLGAAEGLTRSELLLKLGADTWNSWVSMDQPDFRFPGGESKHEHIHRFRAGIEETIAAHPFQTWGVATHGGAMRRFIHFVRPDLLEPMVIPNCTVFKFTASQDSVCGQIRWFSDLQVQV